MPDICMCSNATCRLKWQCYRALAVPSVQQSFAGFKLEVIDGHEVCEYFCILHKGDVIIGRDGKKQVIT